MSNPIDYWYKKYLNKKPELTWQDVEKIDDLLSEVLILFADSGRGIMEPPFYEEVARRFNETKK